MKELIENDIWKWITDYIEASHEFYDNKFSLCPFARKSRLSGNVAVFAWQTGSYRAFIEQRILETSTVKVLVFPPSFRYNWFARYYVKNLNKKLVSKDMYAQCGNAVSTDSRYYGLGGNYSIVIINKLSDILSGHQSLIGTDYYKNWTTRHYYNIVTVRQQTKDKYEKIN